MSYHQKIPIRGGLYPEKGVRWPCHTARKRPAINVYGVIIWNWVITDGCTVLGRCKRRCGPSRNWVNTNSCSVPEGTASISTTVPHRTNQGRYIQLHRTEPCLPLRPTQKPAAISEQRTAPEENSSKPQTTADSTEPQTRRPSTGGQGGTDGKAPSRRPKKRRKEESRDPSTERRGRGWKHKRSLDYMAINSIATADWITADV